MVWHKSNSKWEARIYEGGKQKFLGYYTSEEAAAHAYDTYAGMLEGYGIATGPVHIACSPVVSCVGRCRDLVLFSCFMTMAAQV